MIVIETGNYAHYDRLAALCADGSINDPELLAKLDVLLEGPTHSDEDAPPLEQLVQERLSRKDQPDFNDIFLRLYDLARIYARGFGKESSKSDNQDADDVAAISSYKAIADVNKIFLDARNPQLVFRKWLSSIVEHTYLKAVAKRENRNVPFSVLSDEVEACVEGSEYGGDARVAMVGDFEKTFLGGSPISTNNLLPSEAYVETNVYGNPARIAVAKDFERIFMEAVNTLPEDRADIIKMRYQDMSPEEIAHAKGESTNWVNVNFHRAKKHLAQHLRARGYGEYVHLLYRPLSRLKSCNVHASEQVA